MSAVWKFVAKYGVWLLSTIVDVVKIIAGKKNPPELPPPEDEF